MQELLKEIHAVHFNLGRFRMQGYRALLQGNDLAIHLVQQVGHIGSDEIDRFIMRASVSE